MKMIPRKVSNFLVVVVLFLNFVDFSNARLADHFKHVKSSSSEEEQRQAAQDVVQRLVPDAPINISIDFNLLEDDGNEMFKISSTPENVTISGSSATVALMGVHYFLKQCNCHIAWEGQQLTLPKPLPKLDVKIAVNDRFRYYQNVCTTSYSFVWWNVTQWYKHIDWMALNGINLPLAFTGQEYVWSKVYNRFNLTDEDIEEHFTGPAFLSWNRMGNLRGWGGPLTHSWITNQYQLQLKILARMRSLGMTPVLPAFAGIVPKAFKRIYPQAKMRELTRWQTFDDQYASPYLLDPNDPLFEQIGSTFIKELSAAYGTDHVYNCDTFNEMTPNNGSVSYLQEVGQSIYASMAKADPKAVWVLQNWLFISDYEFWSYDRVKAMLTAVPIGKMIILDLQSEQFPKYHQFNSYFGQPFIWCMLHNFGGTLGLLGSVDIVNERVIAARQAFANVNSTMIGTGLTPEGINQNYVIYDLMTEMFWRKQSVNLTVWFDEYASRRYGSRNANAQAAWQLLKLSVYNYSALIKMRGKYTYNQRPRLTYHPWTWYDTCDVINAWQNLIRASDSLSSELFTHDLVDVTRQVLQLRADYFYEAIIKAYYMDRLETLVSTSRKFLENLDFLQEILASNKAFLLGAWLRDAKKNGETEQEKNLYSFNARNQITLWGPKGEIVDYANKQWAGVVSDFFKPRWELFLNDVIAAVDTKTKFNQTATLEKIFVQVEQPFTFSKKIYPDYSIGNSIEIAKRIYDQIWPEMSDCERPHVRNLPAYGSAAPTVDDEKFY